MGVSRLLEFQRSPWLVVTTGITAFLLHLELCVQCAIKKCSRKHLHLEKKTEILLQSFAALVSWLFSLIDAEDTEEYRNGVMESLFRICMGSRDQFTSNDDDAF